MTRHFDPYDADRPLTMRCSCGRDHREAEHRAELGADGAAPVLRERADTADFAQ